MGLKIAWFTEGGQSGKIPRNFRGMRNDSAWMCTLNADHYNIHDNRLTSEYDLAIIVTDHDIIDYDFIYKNSKCIVDTRGRYKNKQNIIKA